jgi:hypothetical protein
MHHSHTPHLLERCLPKYKLQCCGADSLHHNSHALLRNCSAALATLHCPEAASQEHCQQLEHPDNMVHGLSSISTAHAVRMPCSRHSAAQKQHCCCCRICLALHIMCLRQAYIRQLSTNYHANVAASTQSLNQEEQHCLHAQTLLRSAQKPSAVVQQYCCTRRSCTMLKCPLLQLFCMPHTLQCSCQTRQTIEHSSPQRILYFTPSKHCALSHQQSY